MLIGYARVSTEDQDLSLQIEALKEAGVGKLFEEKASGGKRDRIVLAKLFDQLRVRDIVIVWKLDRLARSLKDLIDILEKIDSAGASFRSITENIDLSTAAGKMQMQIIGAFAEFERAMIRERTKEGLVLARRSGRIGGRPRKIDAEKAKAIVGLVKEGKSKSEVARLFGVSRMSVVRVCDSLIHMR